MPKKATEFTPLKTYNVIVGNLKERAFGTLVKNYYITPKC